MPPKVKVTKEDVLNAAFKLTQKNGWENFNARSIAAELGCSTQPIFRIFENMSALKSELFSYVQGYYNQYIEARMNTENMFQSIGDSYISFAKNESNLFKMLFMSDNFGVTSFMEMIDDDENLELAKLIAKSEKISIEGAKTLYIQTWLFTHGIASMLATNSCSLDEKEIFKLMSSAYRGFILQIKKEEDYHEN